ncbi:MAG: SH3 domain protein [Planctomycetaceae bacterium]|jgi:SH3 domain protein
MKLFVLVLLLSTTLFAASIKAATETVYIRDEIYVPLRAGQSNEYRILHQGIRSGTVLERTEVNEETGFSRVKTPNGLEGWIQNQYLITEPIARDRLRALQGQFVALQADYDTTQKNLAGEIQTATIATASILQLEQERVDLSTELNRITELAANVIQIDQQHESLQTEISALNQQIEDLEVVNANLLDTTNQTWYMIGAGTIFLGLILGLWLGRQMYTRRDPGWS